GIRYEYQTPYRDRDGLIGNFDPTTPTGTRQQTDDRAIYAGDNDNVSPRLGVAWDVTGKGTTVVRAAGSILFSATNFSPFSEVQTVPTGGVFYLANGCSKETLL